MPYSSRQIQCLKMQRKVEGVNFDDFDPFQLSVADFVGKFASMGFQATAIGDAVKIVNEMLASKNPDTGEKTTIFLGYTSNMISSGLRETFRYPRSTQTRFCNRDNSGRSRRGLYQVSSSNVYWRLFDIRRSFASEGYEPNRQPCRSEQQLLRI